VGSGDHRNDDVSRKRYSLLLVDVAACPAFAAVSTSRLASGKAAGAVYVTGTVPVLSATNRASWLVREVPATLAVPPPGAWDRARYTTPVGTAAPFASRARTGTVVLLPAASPPAAAICAGAETRAAGVPVGVLAW